jgi:hypothetical protein
MSAGRTLKYVTIVRASSGRERLVDAHYVEDHNMGKKSANNGRLWKAFSDHIEFLVEDIDRRSASKDAEDDQRGSDIMSQHCTKIDKDGSRTFTF